MADSAKVDTGQDIAEKSPINETKETKDEINEKIKTENKEVARKEDANADPTVKFTDPKASDDAVETQIVNGNEINKAKNSTKTETKEQSKDHKPNKKKGSKKGKKTEEKVEEIPSDVKFVQNHYKFHAKSTLPHILTEYGLEDTDKGHSSAKKEKKKKKKVVEVTEDYESAAASQKKTSNFQNIFGGRPTDSYYMEYIDFLEQKVIQQRLKAQKDKEEAAKLKLLEEEAERKHHFVRRLERVELKHDDTFLKNLPKTDTARIIALQDKLMREGKLKSQYDIDKFWADMKKPEVFFEHFKVNRKDAGHKEDTNSNSNGMADDQYLGPRGLSHISEASKSGEPWAITQKFQSQHLTSPKSASSERRRKDSSQVSKDAALELEKRCPKLEMPPLACFSLKLGEKPPDPEAIAKKLELKSREKTRKKYQRKLNKMYQMAMTNTAVANRILAQHGDLTNILEGAALRDVIAVFDEPYQSLEQYYREMLDPSRAMEIHPEDRTHSASVSQRSSAASSRHTSAGSRKLTPISHVSSRTLSRRKKKSPQMIEYPEPLPLSYDEVYSKEKTMEPKCVSTLWTNYMHAGKSAFAQ